METGPLARNLSRRSLIRRAVLFGMAAGGASLLAACQQAPAPAAKPAEAPKPAADAKPTAAPAAAPAAPAAPTQAPAVAAKPAEAKPAADAKPAAAAAGEADMTRPFVYTVGLDAESLDPHAASDVDYSHNLIRGASEGLIEYVVKPDGTVDVGPLLAKSFTNEGLKTFTFSLQENVKFHDGTPFNSEAVKFNFDRLMEVKKTPAGRLPKIEKIDTPNPNTVVFTLAAPSTDFLYTMTQMMIVSPKAIRDHISDNDQGQKWAAENIVGTGAFTLGARSKGSEATLERNKDYWRGWSGNHIEKAIIKIVKEPATRKLMLEKGDAHLAQALPFTEIESLKTAPGVVVESDQAAGTLTLVMRMRGPLKDVNIRKAMAAAFDSDGFIKAAFRGLAAPPQGPVYSKNPMHDPSIPQGKQDMAKAKDFLSKSSMPNGGFEVSLLILPAQNSYNNAQAQILQDALKSLNITLNITPVPEIAQFYASMQDEEKGADMWAWSGGTQTPDYNFAARRMYGTEYKRPAGVAGGYSNKKFDDLLAEDGQTGDPAKRKQLWAEIQKTLIEDQPAIWCATPLLFHARRDDLMGVPQNVYNFVPNWYNAWIKKK